MKHTLVFVLASMLIFSACAPASMPTSAPNGTLLLTDTPIPTATSTNTPAPAATATAAPTPIPTIQVGNLVVPDPHYSNPELLDLKNPSAPIPQFISAMKMAGIDLTPEQVNQGLAIQERKDSDRNSFLVYVTTRTSNSNADGTPLLIWSKNQKTGEWRWQKPTLSNVLSINRQFQTIGVDLEGPNANNPAIDNIVKAQFNGVTLEIFSWRSMEPAEGVISGEYQRNLLVEKWVQEEKSLHGHVLIWPAKNPAWLNRGKNAQELEQAIRKRIRETMRNYPQITVWNVINEPYLSAPQYRYIRPDVFYEVLGDRAYVIAFEEAYKTNPDATLVLNDTLNHSSVGKNSMTTLRTFQLIKMIREALPNAKLRIGMQMHLNATDLPNEQDVIDTITRMRKEYSVEIGFTEVDVNMSGIPVSNKDRNILQARVYAMVARIATKARVSEVSFWGIGDNNNWLEYYNGQSNADPTMFNDDLTPKISFYAFLRELLAPQ